MSSTQLVDKISVQGNSPASTPGALSYRDVTIPCALGYSGISRTKQEGDGVTPAGQWPLRNVLYRADRVGKIETRLPAKSLSADCAWCDAPGDGNYNCEVALPYPASAERLWRQDGLYDVIVVLGYNDAPVVSGNGSAIFFHIARPGYPPTDGCVAVGLSHMTQLLRLCGTQTIMEIIA